MSIMPTDFRDLRLEFPPTRGRVQRGSATAVFGSTVRRASAALRGFNIGYTEEDHEFFREQIEIVSTSIDNNTVTVTVDFLLRDSSGNIDDLYDGTVRVLVVADVA